MRWLFFLARFACVLLSMIAGFVCYQWAGRLYGRSAAIFALLLWCFSVNVVGHAQLLTPDVGAAAIGLAAVYLFWRWVRRPGWSGALAAGIVLGLAELTKTTWIVLFGLWPLLWIIWFATRQADRSRSLCLKQAKQLAMILLLGIYVINLGYLFEGSFTRLGDYQFISQTLTGESIERDMPVEVGNRFSGSILGAVPVPLPSNYVMGIDVQRRDFERKMWSYLRGEHKLGGWWYYYFYVLAVKVPLGTWVIVFLALGATILGRKYNASWRDELVLLSPAVVVMLLVSSQTGFSHHLRYVLPAFPFAFVWMSKVARCFELSHRKVSLLVVLALVCSISSSLWAYPHSLSYFNEMVGGPHNGHLHLGCARADSNLDWGQNSYYLIRWLDEHPEAVKPAVLYDSTFEIIAEAKGMEVGDLRSVSSAHSTSGEPEPVPGWFALGVKHLYGRTKEYAYFQQYKPVAMAGYSIYIYHITLDEANRVRREMGLPELTDDDVAQLETAHESTN